MKLKTPKLPHKKSKNPYHRIKMGILMGLGVIGGLLIIWIAGSKLFLLGIEMLDYDVVEKKQGYQIRQYDSYLVAEATVPNSFNEGMNNGFRTVAGYIFGDNTKNGSSEKVAMTSPVIDTSQKIAMTSPVVDMGEDENRKIQFVLPSEYTLETLPTPNNDEVTIREIDAQKYAVIRYTGVRTEKTAAAHYEKLKKCLKRDGIEYQDVPVYMYYDPPSTFPWTRRNEVLLPIE